MRQISIRIPIGLSGDFKRFIQLDEYLEWQGLNGRWTERLKVLIACRLYN